MTSRSSTRCVAYLVPVPSKKTARADLKQRQTGPFLLTQEFCVRNYRERREVLTFNKAVGLVRLRFKWLVAEAVHLKSPM